MAIRNLSKLLASAAEDPSGNAVTVCGPDNENGVTLTYRDLLALAEHKAIQLQQKFGDVTSKVVLIYFHNHMDGIVWLWAVVLAGAIPCICPPLAADPEQRLHYFRHLHTLLEKPLIITTRSLALDLPISEGLCVISTDDIESLHSEHHSASATLQGYAKNEQDLAVLMLTSGSTGNSKAVSLTHGQIICSVNGKRIHHGMTNRDVFLNWIGLDHVANLIEIHLHAASLAAQQTLNSYHQKDVQGNESHIPGSAIGVTTGTHDSSLRVQIARGRVADFELSSLRALVSGGESNVVDTCTKLSAALQNYGAPGAFIRPGFGMTETCAGSIYNTVDCPEYDVSQGTEFCSLGECIQGIQMRIMQPDGTESNVNEIGLLEVSGPVVFSGYYRDEKSTQQAFKHQGWFSTGDLGLLDPNGRLRLTGREKDTIVINGVNFYSQAIEAAIEEAVPGVTPSYTAAFSYRPKDSATECICVAYLRPPTEIDSGGSARTNIGISNAVVKYCGTRPSQIIALPASLLRKSSLGKLSRSKIRQAFENGDYNKYIVDNQELIPQLRLSDVYDLEETTTQTIILNHLYTLFGINFDYSATTSDIFSLGVSSIDLLQLRARLQDNLGIEIPITTFFSASSVYGLGQCIDALRKKKEYEPIAILQEAGSKTPLFIIHPGMGDVLIFMNLARYITDRPVYALRARGFDGEEPFSSMDEMITVYYAAIKRMQPKGSYAIVGYLFGSIVAFELAKKMEANGDVVQFLATIDQPPHLKLRAAMYDWYQTVVTVSVFMGLIKEDYAYASLPMLRQKSHGEVIDHIRGLADPVLLDQIGMSRERLQNWANLAYQFKVIARQYDPEGLVAKMHVFYTKARTTATKVQSEQQWFDDHISKWRDFASHVTFHRVGGKHTTAISPPNVLGFQKLLKSIMEENGL